jgi:D-serine deaminase-like pyridoxal phosphate-dependent protein
MNQKALVRVAADSVTGVNQLAVAALEVGQEIGVLVEVNIGMNRGGVDPGEEAVRLAEYISRTDGVRFEGLQAYEGHLVMLQDFGERKRLVEKDMRSLLETKEMLKQRGMPNLISSGGTGTYSITGKIRGIDELQCGSYALMDTAYKNIRPEFLYARYVLATITSARESVVVADVGLKGIGNEYGVPVILDHPEAKVLYLAEEHMVIENLDAGIGEKIKIIPPHGCTTNNLYSRMWISRHDIIENIWEIEGRGCLE